MLNKSLSKKLMSFVVNGYDQQNYNNVYIDYTVLMNKDNNVLHSTHTII